MLRRLLLAVLVALPGGGLGAQGVRLPAAGPAKPDWIENLPEVPGRLYAMGTAELSGTEGDAIARASDRARLGVVSRLRATVKGRTSVTTRTSELQQPGGKASGAGERQVRDEVSVGAAVEDLPGLVVERTHSDPVGRTVYALAYLDLAVARGALAARLDQAKASRIRVGDELSRKARWRLRKLQDELGRIDGAITLLAFTGTGLELRPALQTERGAVDKALQRLENKDLPPMDLSRTAMGLRANVEFPPGIQAYLESQILECGLVYRNLNPDLILSFTFAGGARGPEFIYVDVAPYSGVTYQLDAKMVILEGEGLAITRPVPLQLSQSDSPEGMVNQFRRLFERRLPKLVAEVVTEVQ
jgi:hypothetical protein